MSLNESFFQLEYQDGNAMHILLNEHTTLVIVLALHKKDQTALDREKYHEALILFLETDQEFTKCIAEFLETVETYALLHLDLVCFYLYLKSLTQLPEAALLFVKKASAAPTEMTWIACAL